MPGVSVTTEIRQGAGGADVVPSSTFFVVGTSERGPADSATLIVSTNDFERIYGGYNANYSLHQSVKTFFEEGGTRCYVARVVDGGSTATVTLDNTVNVESVGIGTAYDAVAIAVSSGNDPAKVRLTVTIDGIILWKSADLASRDDIIAAINANVGYLVSASADTTDALPAVGDYTLDAGGDGSTPDASDHVDALDLFSYELGTGAVAIPGKAFDTAVGASSTIGEQIAAHCAANNRIGLLAAGQATTSANLIDDLADADPVWYAKEDMDRVALYFPWVTIPDGFGGSLEISPEAFVAAGRARAHMEFGPWKPGAGAVTAARYVNGLALPSTNAAYTRALADTMDTAQINTLRVINGAVQVYGVNTLTGDVDNWRFISYRDMVNYVVTEIEEALEPYVFSTIDSRGGVLGEVEATVRATLAPLSASGGLYSLVDANGTEVDPGFSILAGTVNNPVTSLAEGKIAVQIGLRVSAVAEMINVTIYKSGLTSAV